MVTQAPLELTERESVAWDMYFSSIMSMQEHPGMNRENATRKTLAECAQIATDAVLERREAIKCRGDQ